MDNRQYIWDSLLKMKDSYKVAASAAASVDSVHKYYNTGGGYTEGMCVIDLTVMTITAGSNQRYDICVQGSDTTTFTDIVTLARLSLGLPALCNCTNTPSAGRYLLPFTNKFDDVDQKYLRIYTVCGGTTVSGITYSAFFSKLS